MWHTLQIEDTRDHVLYNCHCEKGNIMWTLGIIHMKQYNSITEIIPLQAEIWERICWLGNHIPTPCQDLA